MRLSGREGRACEIEAPGCGSSRVISSILVQCGFLGVAGQGLLLEDLTDGRRSTNSRALALFFEAAGEDHSGLFVEVQLGPA